MNPLPSKNRFKKARHEIYVPTRVAQRAGTNFMPNADGCWISNYSTGSHGYAQIGWYEDKEHYGTTAHRASWINANGQQIPEGMTVDHLCKNRRCVNPRHLRLLDNFENARRTSGWDWETGKCKNGHPNSELYWTAGRYRCKPCTLASKKKSRDKKKRLRQEELSQVRTPRF